MVRSVFGLSDGLVVGEGKCKLLFVGLGALVGFRCTVGSAVGVSEGPGVPSASPTTMCAGAGLSLSDSSSTIEESFG